MRKLVIAVVTACVLAMYTYAAKPIFNGRPVAAILRKPSDPARDDLAALAREERAHNSKMVGWLRVPDTKVDYPIVHDPTLTNNGFYTMHNALGEPEPNGTTFADRRSRFGSGERSDLARLTVLYGHSFSDDQNGALMDSIKRYRDEDFARTHPYIYFSTWEENMAFEVVAVFDAHVGMPYNRHDLTEEEYARMLEDIQDLSYYTYGTKPSPDDKLLVISCCTYQVMGHPELPMQSDYRFAVMGRLVEEGEATKSRADLSVNRGRAAPDSYMTWFY